MDVPVALFRAARSALELSRDELAKITGLSVRTINKVERGDHVKIETARRIQAGFEQLGIKFLDPVEDAGAGLRIPKDLPKRSADS
jgi:transcriptional regulator with XRE-family HTH domain